MSGIIPFFDGHNDTILRLFDPRRDPPCLLAPGQRVRFRAIGAAEFERLAAA